jgi:uncharacterized protein YneF (UPF0154 family)
MPKGKGTYGTKVGVHLKKESRGLRPSPSRGGRRKKIMEVFIILLALGVSTAIGAVIGFYVASKWQFYIKIARKEDYEVKLKELEDMLQNLMGEANDKGPEYKPFDMFPPNLDPEYGLPRSMKE